MVILGIDPGTATMGYGVVKKTQNLGIIHVAHGCLETPKTMRAEQRLLLLEKGVQKLFRQFKPDVLAIERLFFFRNVKTALPVSEARGVVLLCAAKQKLPLVEFAPLQAKMAITGYGRADKKQMQAMVQKLLGLSSPPQPDDAADALAVAIACAIQKKF